MDFHEILYLSIFRWIFMKFYMSIFRKSAKTIQVPLKSDKKNGYFACTQIYIYDHFTFVSS